MKTILILTRKDLQLLFIDKTSLIVTFLLPVVLVALIGSVFGNAFPPSVGITSFDYAFSKVMFWGLMGGVASSVASLAIEKSSGTIIRLQVAPLNKFHLLAGKALACVIVLMISSTITWLFATLLFNITTTAPFSLLVVCLSASVFFAGFMTFLAHFVKTERAAGGLSWSMMQVLACFSGIMFPIAIMPKWMSAAADFNPLTWAVKGMESALWKDGLFSDLLLPVGITLGAGIFFFLITLWLFRWTSSR